jgi:hypothetical protein
MSSITAGDLRRQLEGLPEDTEIIFQGGMTFYRTKWRGENTVQIEFNEVQVPMSKVFRRKYPDVFVAFCRVDGPAEGKPIRMVEVPEL